VALRLLLLCCCSTAAAAALLLPLLLLLLLLLPQLMLLLLLLLLLLLPRLLLLLLLPLLPRFSLLTRSGPAALGRQFQRRSCECAIHLTTHSTSPDAVRTPARQYPLPFSSCPTHTLTCVTRATLSQEHIGVGRPRGEAERRLYSAHRLHSTVSFASRATLELGQALRTRRAVRSSHTPV
jgi:hypothetical protein